MNERMNNQYGVKKRKWVTVGGSYAGALSAWFKSTHGSMVEAAWASSAVIEA